MFKISKLNNVSNENITITSSKTEIHKAGIGIIGYKLALTFDITGKLNDNNYSFGFDLTCNPEDLLNLNHKETITYNNYKCTNDKFHIGETFFNFNEENGIEPDELNIKITKYINDRYLVYITFIVDDYSGVIEFDFKLDNYLKDFIEGNKNELYN